MLSSRIRRAAPSFALGIACSVALMWSTPAAYAQANPDPLEAFRRQIEEQLDAEDGYFLLIFNQQNSNDIYAASTPPRQARRLPGNKWLEVLYQVELVENREAAAELMLKFFLLREETARPGVVEYDWQLAGRYAEENEAKRAFQQALETAQQRNVTLQEYPADAGVKFFNFGRPKFFQ